MNIGRFFLCKCTLKLLVLKNCDFLLQMILPQISSDPMISLQEIRDNNPHPYFAAEFASCNSPYLQYALPILITSFLSVLTYVLAGAYFQPDTRGCQPSLTI